MASVFSAEPCRHWLSQQEVHAPCVFSDLPTSPFVPQPFGYTLTTCCSKLSIFRPLPACLPSAHLPPAAGSSVCQLCALRGPAVAAPALCLLPWPPPQGRLPSFLLPHRPSGFPWNGCRALPEPTTGVPPGPSLGAFLRLNCYPQYPRGQLACLPASSGHACLVWDGPWGSWGSEKSSRGECLRKNREERMQGLLQTRGGGPGRGSGEVAWGGSQSGLQQGRPGRCVGAEAVCVCRLGAPPAVVPSAKPSPPGGVRCVRGLAGGGKTGVPSQS